MEKVTGQWIRQRQISTCGILMEKHSNKNAAETVKLSNNPFTKLMTPITMAEHATISSTENDAAENARKKWASLHSARQLMSPSLGACWASHGSAKHALKSQILTALNFEEIKNIGKQWRPIRLP